MGKKGKSGATQNDKIFDYIYDSTFWPEYMGDAVPLLGTGGLKEILKGSRSKREARNRLLLAYKKAQEDGGNRFGELMDNAVREYATNYMQPGDAMPEFIWKQERFTDLDPTNTSVEDILAQAGNIASALGYGEDEGSVEQMLTDLYGRNLDMGLKEPTSRDFVESYGKLSELLKSPIATDMLYRNIGLPFDNDPENLYGYISGIADRANRIRRQNARPAASKAFTSFLTPYITERELQGNDATVVDGISDLLSLGTTAGGLAGARAVGNMAKSTAKGKLAEYVSKRGASNFGAAGIATILNAVPDAVHGGLDSLTTKHVYTTDENGNPDYIERAKFDPGAIADKAMQDLLIGSVMLGLSGHNFGSKILKSVGLDKIPGKIGEKLGPIKKKAVGAFERLFDGDIPKKIAKEKKLQARAEAQVETLSGKRSELDALLAEEKAKIRKNPFGVKDLKGEARLEAVGKELKDIIKKGEQKQALANKHLAKAEKLEQERVSSTLKPYFKDFGKYQIIRAYQNGLVPTTASGFYKAFDFIKSFNDR